MTGASPGPVSIVIPAHNEGENVVDTVGVLLEHTQAPRFEIIVVDDASSDGSGEHIRDSYGGDGRVQVLRAEGIGVARARNLGAGAASGEVLIFLDGHSYTPPGWLAPLLRPLAGADVGLVGPGFGSLVHGGAASGFGMRWQDAGMLMQWLPRNGNEPYEVPVIPGCCHVMRRDVFEALGGYDPSMTRWGSEDEEMCLRLWLGGYRVLVQPQATVYHLFRSAFPYRIEPAEVIHNRLRVALLHFNAARAGRVLRHHQRSAEFVRAVQLLVFSDLQQRRQTLERGRQRDDDWFFAHFGFDI